MSDDEREERELDLTSPEVVTKYKSAAEIVNKALQLVLSECKPKAKIVDLCEKGDSYIINETGKMYKNVKKKIERGVAFPTCISVNNVVCHFSPLASDESVLEEGDIVKIDMGCHIDGFIATVAHTHVIQEGPVSGRKADVIAAANTAAEVALRLVRPGKKNKDVTEAIQKVAEAYDCKIVEGVLSHQLKQFVIDGNKVVLSVSSPDMRVDDAEFEENEVYAIDIVTSTGEGKPRMLDEKQTTIYKRAVDKNYHLKMKASRFIFSEINQKFPIMPFTARALEEKRARLGLVECVNHDLLQPYPVLHEKPDDFVAHIKFTVLLMPNGSDRVTSHALQELQPTKTVDDPEIKAWLALGTKTKKKGGGKKKKGNVGSNVKFSVKFRLQIFMIFSFWIVVFSLIYRQPSVHKNNSLQHPSAHKQNKHIAQNAQHPALQKQSSQPPSVHKRNSLQPSVHSLLGSLRHTRSAHHSATLHTPKQPSAAFCTQAERSADRTILH